MVPIHTYIAIIFCGVQSTCTRAGKVLIRSLSTSVRSTEISWAWAFTISTNRLLATMSCIRCSAFASDGGTPNQSKQVEVILSCCCAHVYSLTAPVDYYHAAAAFNGGLMDMCCVRCLSRCFVVASYKSGQRFVWILASFSGFTFALYVGLSMSFEMRQRESWIHSMYIIRC